ncbi:unnamed protein product [Trichogramma brassicae]|uniref:Uncharacterized protein n=1 Tax=Trichogramma brassicae TaxID=86971 RepID=A0A6H5ID21_9HYME|nr:unnamed protein product [Trichogramma brassicae]
MAFQAFVRLYAGMKKWHDHSEDLHKRTKLPCIHSRLLNKVQATVLLYTFIHVCIENCINAKSTEFELHKFLLVKNAYRKHIQRLRVKKKFWSNFSCKDQLHVSPAQLTRRRCRRVRDSGSLIARRNGLGPPLLDSVRGVVEESPVTPDKRNLDEEEVVDKGGDGKPALMLPFPSLGLRPERILLVRLIWTSTPGFKGHRGTGGCCCCCVEIVADEWTDEATKQTKGKSQGSSRAKTNATIRSAFLRRPNPVQHHLPSSTQTPTARSRRSPTSYAHPPAQDRYTTLKDAIVARLTDSPDTQLHKLLGTIELGDKKPSQLLLQMRTLAGARASNDILRVRWLDLLPDSTRRLLTIIKNQTIDELAAVADDELHAVGPSVMATEVGRPRSRPASPGGAASSNSNSVGAQEIAELRAAIVQLTEITREALQRRDQPRGRSRSRTQPRSQSRPRSPTPHRGSTEGYCWYHERYGDVAEQCRGSRVCSHPKARQEN